MTDALTACCPSCGRAMPAGDMQIDRDRRTVSRNGHTVYLKPSHLLILEWLATSPGRPVQSADLLALIRQEGREYVGGGSKLVMVHVSHLRRCLDPLGIFITSLWGVGYFLEFGDPADLGRHLEERRHRDARFRTAPRNTDIEMVARLVDEGVPAEDIATRCRLSLGAVAKAMAAVSAPAKRAAA